VFYCSLAHNRRGAKVFRAKPELQIWETPCTTRALHVV